MMKGLLGSGFAIRRALVALAMTAVTATGLSGCLFAHDAAKPMFVFANDYSEPVVVILERGDSEIERLVSSGGSTGVTLTTCYGTGIRVESESGEALGRVDEQACPDWELTINQDGSLTYKEETG